MEEMHPIWSTKMIQMS